MIRGAETGEGSWQVLGILKVWYKWTMLIHATPTDFK